MRLAGLGVWLAIGCSSAATPPVDGGADSPPATDPFDVPIDGLDAMDLKTFFDGDELFGLPLHDSDGLGPLYIRTSCAACHTEGVRGPGSVQKMSVVLADGISTDPDQSKLPFGHTARPLKTAGATQAIAPPMDPSVKITLRVGPPILGRGYMDAVLDSEIVRVAAEQAMRADAIHGRVNHLVYGSEPNPDQRFFRYKKGDMVIGRFGLKARLATVEEFTADALQGDMGITSPIRPNELPNPDGLTDDMKPGVDITAESMNTRANYIRLTAIPRRDVTEEGAKVFAKALCSVCHVPALKTRADYPYKQLAGIDAPVFTDMLLHDMGDKLADGTTEGEAKSRDWKTAPLIGLRFNNTFLHDSRAASVEQAILDHDGPGSEATGSVKIFQGLSTAERQALLDYVNAL